jgi:Icc-related predicted phosphoesterase
MTLCFFASDLHGQTELYLRLFDTIAGDRPGAVFLGGDLLPTGPREGHGADAAAGDFLDGFLFRHLRALRTSMSANYPRVFAILGNDDRRADEQAFLDAESSGLLKYLHLQQSELAGFDIYGYACTPPSPFSLKDWERYDVSRYTDPGAVSPEAGRRTVQVSPREARFTTIQEELDALVGDRSLDRAVMLFHSPPYKTKLDRADLDGQTVDHAPLDVHVGSIAIRRLIEHRQPAVTLHGHVHESARLTGAWSDRIGRTICMSAAHDGPELALVRFALEQPGGASRILL